MIINTVVLTIGYLRKKNADPDHCLCSTNLSSNHWLLSLQGSTPSPCSSKPPLLRDHLPTNTRPPPSSILGGLLRSQLVTPLVQHKVDALGFHILWPPNDNLTETWDKVPIYRRLYDKALERIPWVHFFISSVSGASSKSTSDTPGDIHPLLSYWVAGDQLLMSSSLLRALKGLVSSARLALITSSEATTESRMAYTLGVVLKHHNSRSIAKHLGKSLDNTGHGKPQITKVVVKDEQFSNLLRDCCEFFKEYELDISFELATEHWCMEW